MKKQKLGQKSVKELTTDLEQRTQSLAHSMEAYTAAISGVDRHADSLSPLDYLQHVADSLTACVNAAESYLAYARALKNKLGGPHRSGPSIFTVGSGQTKKDMCPRKG